MLRSGLAFLPYEKGRLVGQSILISPPRHPLWARLATAMVDAYDSRCYETLNTGPDKLTSLWNAWCGGDVMRGVVLHDGMIRGPVTMHRTVSHAPDSNWCCPMAASWLLACC